MSTYEKIASVLLVILVIAVASLWFGHPHDQPGFEDSQGQDFKLGPFDTVLSEQAVGGQDPQCAALEPVITAALHDLYVRLSAQGPLLGVAGRWDDFEVNAAALDALCAQSATMTLRDAKGDTLTLVKAPFERAVPKGGAPEDIGTTVSLSASITPVGGTAPAAPQASVRMLIPDRFLE